MKISYVRSSVSLLLNCKTTSIPVPCSSSLLWDAQATLSGSRRLKNCLLPPGHTAAIHPADLRWLTAFQPTTLGYYWFLQLVLATEMFHLRYHLRYYPDETLSKEGVQDLVHGESILLHFTKWVLTTITEMHSSVLIRKNLRKKNIVIASITRERL